MFSPNLWDSVGFPNGPKELVLRRNACIIMASLLGGGKEKESPTRNVQHLIQVKNKA